MAIHWEQTEEAGNAQSFLKTRSCCSKQPSILPCVNLGTKAAGSGTSQHSCPSPCLYSMQLGSKASTGEQAGKNQHKKAPRRKKI